MAYTPLSYIAYTFIQAPSSPHAYICTSAMHKFAPKLLYFMFILWRLSKIHGPTLIFPHVPLNHGIFILYLMCFIKSICPFDSHTIKDLHIAPHAYTFTPAMHKFTPKLLFFMFMLWRFSKNPWPTHIFSTCTLEHRYIYL